MLSTLLAFLALCPSPAGNDPADVLRAADRAFFQATRERGLEGWLAAFAEDAVVFPDVGALAVGSAAIRRHYSGLGGFPPEGFLWEPEEAGISAEHDLGWTRGRWGNDASGSAVWAGRYLSVWRKEKDGSWRVVADCSFAPDFATRLGGLGGAPVMMGRESECSFASARGDLVASAGSWFASDGDAEVGGKFLSVWRKNTDGTLELVLETGLAQAKR